MTHRLSRASFAAATLALALFAQAAQADDPPHSRSRTPLQLASLCIEGGSTPECSAAFTAALRAASTESERVADAVIVSAGRAGNGPRLHAPLRFQKRAPWVRRLETLGKEGLPFVRMPRGPQSELVVGINRKGVLGFELKQTSR